MKRRNSIVVVTISFTVYLNNESSSLPDWVKGDVHGDVDGKIIVADASIINPIHHLTSMSFFKSVNPPTRSWYRYIPLATGNPELFVPVQRTT